MKLLDQYIKVANALNCEMSEEDPIWRYTGMGTPTPVTVSDMMLVMPYPNLLAKGEFDNVIAFHPLSENIVRGESPVLRRLRRLINLRVTTSALALLNTMIAIASTPALQESMDIADTKFLDVLKDADEKTVTLASSVNRKLNDTGDNCFMRTYLKRGGTYKGKKYSRVAVVTFPIMAEANNDDGKIFGVKMSKAQKRTILAGIEYILPGCSAETDNPYSYGSDSSVAPFFDSLMNSFLLMAKAINKAAKPLQKYVDDIDAILIPTDWKGMLKELDKLSLEIPPLAGNEGIASTEQERSDNAARFAIDAANPGFNPANAVGGDVGAERKVEVVAEETVVPAPTRPTVTRPTQTTAPVRPTTPTRPADGVVRPTAHRQPAYEPPAAPTDGVVRPSAQRGESGGKISWNEVQNERQRQIEEANRYSYTRGRFDDRTQQRTSAYDSARGPAAPSYYDQPASSRWVIR